jgi:hypothetical protein
MNAVTRVRLVCAGVDKIRDVMRGVDGQIIRVGGFQQDGTVEAVPANHIRL